MKETIYRVIDVKVELPEETTWYFVCDETGSSMRVNYFFCGNKKWLYPDYTHWLKRTESNMFSDEELEDFCNDLRENLILGNTVSEFLNPPPKKHFR